MKTEANADKYENETQTTVETLNAETRRNIRSWLVCGAAIALYLEKTKQANGDAFKKLAEHEDSLLGANSLRSYYAAWKLWNAMGKNGVPASVEYTHYVVVATSAINLQDRFKLLQQAEKEKWSVSELKKRIRLLRQGAKIPEPKLEDNVGGNDKQTAAVKDWNTVCKSLENQTAHLIDDLTFMGAVKSDANAPKELRQNVRAVVRLLIANGLIDLDYIHELMPKDARVAA